MDRRLPAAGRGPGAALRAGRRDRAPRAPLGPRLPARRPGDRRARSGRGAGRARLRREARADLRRGRRAVRSRSVRRALPDAAGHRGAGADRGRGRRRALRGPPGSGRALHHDRRAPAPRHRRPRRLLARPPAVARAPRAITSRTSASCAGSWTRTSPAREPREILARACDAACRLAGVRGALALAGSGPGRDRRARGRGTAAPASGPSGSARTTTLLAEGFAADGPVAIRDLQARRRRRGPACSSEDGHPRGPAGADARARARGGAALPGGPGAARVLAGGDGVRADARGAHRGARSRRSGSSPRAATRSPTDEARPRPSVAAGGAGARAGRPRRPGSPASSTRSSRPLLGKRQLLLARAPNDPLREGLVALEEAAWRGTDRAPAAARAGGGRPARRGRGLPADRAGGGELRARAPPAPSPSRGARSR